MMGRSSAQKQPQLNFVTCLKRELSISLAKAGMAMHLGARCPTQFTNPDRAAALRAFWGRGPNRQSNCSPRGQPDPEQAATPTSKAFSMRRISSSPLSSGSSPACWRPWSHSDTLTNPFTVKIALAAMAAGYAGADFVENTYSALGAALGAGGGSGKRPGGAPNRAGRK